MTARGLPVDLEVLRQQADLHLSDAPKEIVSGVWTTGGIAERREPEGRSSQHFVRDGEGWMPDPYRDDMSLVLDIPDGLVLVCGCCHAGLLNTLSQVRQTFGRHPVAVVGGTHLISADEGHLRHLVEVLERLGPPALYPNHCTGQTAYVALARAFGDRVAPCPAGTVLEF
jgi:7,8-dihydropterin-6-yl-methyl-4-(beta-D-ribofuranosyl)aminobenzene 5'-phosphate synthase